MKKRTGNGIFCGMMTGICWAVSGVFSQYLFTNTDMQSGWFVAVRMLAAGVFMLFLTMMLNRKEMLLLLKNKRDLLQCSLSGIFGTMLFQFACYGTVQKSNAATAIVLQYLCPAMVMVYSCMKGRKLPGIRETAALFLALLGIFMIATHGSIHELVITGEALALGVGCAFFMSLCTILPESLYKKYSVQTVTSFSLVSGGIAAGIIVNPLRNPPHMDAAAGAALAAAVACGSILAYILYGAAVRWIGSAKASLYACTEIPAATILSVLFLNNSFMWMDIAGFVLIGSTIFILPEKNSREPQ